MGCIQKLRNALTARGIDHSDIGRKTSWEHDGIRWLAVESWVGDNVTLQMNGWGEPSDVLKVAANVADTKRNAYVEDGVVGHYVCGNCGCGVSPSDRYCSNCGARLRMGDS